MNHKGYTRLTLNPTTGVWQRAQWIPNWSDVKGWTVVRFPGMRGTVDTRAVALETKNG